MKLATVTLLLALIAGCKGKDSSASPAPPPAAQPPPVSRPPEVSQPTVAPTRSPAPAAAAPRPWRHPPCGAKVWAVYVYVGDGGREAKAAEKLLKARGLEQGADFGAADLGFDEVLDGDLDVDGEIAVSVWFRTQADAEAFAATLPHIAGIAKVKLGCAD